MEQRPHDHEPINPNSPEHQLDGETLRDLAELHRNWWSMYRQAGRSPAFDDLRSAIGDLQIVFTADLGERVAHHSDTANRAVEQLAGSDHEADIVLASALLYHHQHGLVESGRMRHPETEAERWRGLFQKVSSYDALDAVGGDARSIVDMAKTPDGFVDRLVAIMSEASRIDEP